MIKTSLSIAALLVAFLLMMSITVNNKPLFSHVYELISPATKFAQSKTEEFFADSFKSTQNYSKKIFDNSVPKVKDSVKSKLSSQKKVGGEPEEKITTEEKRELNDLIKNH